MLSGTIVSAKSIVNSAKLPWRAGVIFVALNVTFQ